MMHTSRRDMLKGTVALAAAASVGVATPTRWRRAEAQESAALPRARIDGVLRQVVDAKDVPGVVAMAATAAATAWLAALIGLITSSFRAIG